MSRSAPASPSAAAPAARREALRRFHFGDREAAVDRLAADLLPAALAPLRGEAVRSGWPLVVDPTPGAGPPGPLAQPLEELLGTDDPALPPVAADNVPRLVRRLAAGSDLAAAAAIIAAAAEVADELALAEGARRDLLTAIEARMAGLGEDARLVPFGPRAVLHLANFAALRRAATARRAFAATAQELAGLAAALLDLDRERRPDGVEPPERVERLGGFGGRFVDPGRLAGVVGRRAAGQPLSDERRRRLAAARDALAGFDLRPATPLWLLPATESGVDPAADLAAEMRLVADPCEAAAVAWDESAEPVARLVRAARLVRLESADALDPERHLPWLDHLDWRAFEDGERALVRPILARVRCEDLIAGGLAAFSRLLLSSRPVQIVLLACDRGPVEETVHFEPAWFALGHRETFVQSGSPARPRALVAGLERALGGSRPALHVVDNPVAAAAGLDPWLLASARVSGRAAPIFRYDPGAGASWARRLAFDENPEPEADWAREPLPGGEPAPFTFADAALADPAWRPGFALAGEEDDLVPLAEWLDLADEEAARRLPFVAAVDAAGSPRRCLVDHRVAAAARDRRAFWRSLQELTGVRSEHVDAAVARAREEERSRAARERAELEVAHQRELAELRSGADAEAVDRLVGALFDLQGSAPTAPLPRAAAPPPATAGAVSPAAPPAAAPEAAAPEVEEAWVDTALCTSCDECTRRLPSVFAYNANKQAYVRDPRGASFRDIVAVAEVCTAKIIHPGTPWNPDEAGLAATLERAAALAAR